MATDCSEGVYRREDEKEKVWFVAAQVPNNAVDRKNLFANEARN
jgi:hypothetical protein